MAEIGPDFRGGYYGDQVEPSGGGWDPAEQKPSGPLAKLYGSSTFDFNNRFYPRNLATDTRGHYINFYINVAQNSTYLTKDRYKIADTGLGRTQANQLNGNTVTKYNLNQLSDSLPSITLGRKTKRITQAISLYMPETMSVQYNSNWESSSLTDAGGKLLFGAQVGKGIWDDIDMKNGNTLKNLASNPSNYAAIAEVVGNAAGGGDTADFLLQATGSALNPQLEVLFKGTNMREFQFDFLFAPYDETEAKNVMEIIKMFKFHMAPEINTGMMGRYFTPPSEFDIDFLFAGQINKNVHKLSTCVLTNMSVDYAPNGWSTFNNGMPTHTKLTLQFMETEIITKQRVDEGY